MQFITVFQLQNTGLHENGFFPWDIQKQKLFFLWENPIVGVLKMQTMLFS